MTCTNATVHSIKWGSIASVEFALIQALTEVEFNFLTKTRRRSVACCAARTSEQQYEWLAASFENIQ